MRSFSLLAAQLLLSTSCASAAPGLLTRSHEDALSTQVGLPMPERPTMAAQMLEKYYYCAKSKFFKKCSRQLTSADAVGEVVCSGESDHGLPFCGKFTGKNMFVDYVDAFNSMFEGETTAEAIFQGPPGVAAYSWTSDVTLKETGKKADQKMFGMCTMHVSDKFLVTAWKCVYDHTAEIELIRDAEEKRAKESPEMQALKDLVECTYKGDNKCVRQMTSPDCVGYEECGGEDLSNTLPYCGAYKGNSSLFLVGFVQIGQNLWSTYVCKKVLRRRLCIFQPW
eukprot:TRINITY_DN5470_c0_g1_i2.p1 TRINITY_DN5470_c0_g1~~TRINITY_DN5470_c0_g1_i2.p1  ORF type:complete len:281 (-),score=27.38 TRINITY_DN5470_c0_g1_i2:747-1589(-)